VIIKSISLLKILQCFVLYLFLALSNSLPDSSLLWVDILIENVPRTLIWSVIMDLKETNIDLGRIPIAQKDILLNLSHQGTFRIVLKCLLF
jgi:hypothetical protein